jgi:hypothetical protein
MARSDRRTGTGNVTKRGPTGPAVTELKVSLVVVLGHQDCRAVAAAVEAVYRMDNGRVEVL